MSDNISFNQRPYAHRYSVMGDTAEAAFERVNPNAHRLGVKRPEFSILSLPPVLRHAPDYMMATGLYEVMGISSRGDGTLKLKLEKIESLQKWAMFGPCHLWVWDSGKKRFYCTDINTWVTACHMHATIEKFPDNDKPFWKLHFKDFPVEPNSGI